MNNCKHCNNEDFLTLRRAIYRNFIAKDATTKEKDLTLADLCDLVNDVGYDYIMVNKRGVFEMKTLRTRTEKWEDPE